MLLWRYGRPVAIVGSSSRLEDVPDRDGVAEILLFPLEQYRHRIRVPFLNRAIFSSAIPPRRSAVTSSPPIRRRQTAYRHPKYIGNSPSAPHKRFPRLVFALAGGISGLLLILALVFTFLLPLLTPHATVTLIPRAQAAQNTFSLFANQIRARQITATASPQSATGRASGTIPATKATGTLTFLNQTSTDITLQSAIITDKNGIQVSFTGPLLVPATTNNASATTTGTAVQAGARGNIPSFDITMPCCAPNHEIVVENTTAFTGGADARPNARVLQNDIDQAAKALQASQTQQEQAQLATQVQSGEQAIARTMQCQPQVQSDVPAGTHATSVTVTVAVTCTEEVYNQAAAQALASSQLNAQAPTGYMLSGRVMVSAPAMTDANTIQIHAQGQWLYHFSQTQLNQMALLVAGKSQAQAQTLLLQQTGVSDVHISGPITLPSADHIQIQVQPGG